ncbi:DsbA family protein [Candidatus Falkowbacteria bacterium]|nr:DsbA family protein [Candidatus Falkowbacteria bacterium]
MKKSIFKQKFFTPLFIASSAVAIFIFIFSVMLLRGIIFYNQPAAAEQSTSPDPYAEFQTDPFITKVPTAKDLITKPIINGSDPILGDMKSPITIIQFSDFTCSYCGSQELQIRKLMDEYPGKIKLIWKDYPEKDTASISHRAAIAGRCAASQGKFWQYHDLVFQGGSKISAESLTSIAKKLTLNMIDFNKCFKDSLTAQSINNNMIEANALGITGIPFLFVNDKEFMGEVTFAELKQTVESLLK